MSVLTFCKNVEKQLAVAKKRVEAGPRDPRQRPIAGRILDLPESERSGRRRQVDKRGVDEEL